VDQLQAALDCLSSANSGAEFSALLRFLGFSAPALPLDTKAITELELPLCVRSASVASATGCLRALIVECDSDITTRELLQHTALRLSRKVPHLKWLAISRNAAGGDLGVACWDAAGSIPRVVALVISGQRVLASDAETLCALAAAQSTSDILTHARWIELLGRQAITRRFFRTLSEVVENLACSLPAALKPADRRELSLLLVSRLLFLAFVETKGWLAGDFDFLSNSFARCSVASGGFHRHVLEPLFFGTLNTRYSARAARARSFGRIPFLNGGLFTRTPLEKQTRGVNFTDDAVSEMFDRLLTSFRFSAREDSAHWSETAVDPEILGKAFEALMAATERRTSGAFYTPQRLVEHVTESALVAALSPSVAREILRSLLASGEIPDPAERSRVLSLVEGLRVLDPACGSGAFLVHALERLAELRLRLGEIGSISTIRRRTLTSSIFGVDVNPMATWLCQLRLWLAILIDSIDPDPMRATPLPNLDRQIRVGDSLAGGSFAIGSDPMRGHRLASLRARYIRAIGPRKKTLSSQLDREERAEALRTIDRTLAHLRSERREALLAARTRDLFGERMPATGVALDRLRVLKSAQRSAEDRQRRLKSGAALPFAFDVHFADVSAAGGFDVIVGNPPWVRIHNITPAFRRSLHREFATLRNGGWREGAALAGSGHAFASQVDLAALFVERSISLLRDEGSLALLLPAKLWGSLSGGGVRETVRAKLDIVALEDISESRSGFDAAVYPSLLVGRRRMAREPKPKSSFAAAVFRYGSAVQWELDPERLPLDGSSGSPWLLIPDDVRHAFDRIADAGTPLALSRFGRPLLGVKTGCNAAYVIRETSRNNGAVSVAAGERTGMVEAALLRPMIRGETATAWRLTPNAERILFTHDKTGAPLRRLPPNSASWLKAWRPELEARTDCRGSATWWSLYRTEGADPTQPRVVWGDFGKTPRALVLDAGDDAVPINSCYVARCPTREDALALCALLNGPLLAAWLNTIAEPARGGYRRYMAWTVALMPLPKDWPRARDELYPLAERALSGKPPTPHDLLCAALRAYRLRGDNVEALLSWSCRT
jgi:hypothetical protein